MSASEFIAYVGPADIHDSTVVSVARASDSVQVDLCALDGKRFSLTFHGVTSVQSQQPEGMFVYALTELAFPTQLLRRFALANSDDDSAARLEIIAESFTADL